MARRVRLAQRAELVAPGLDLIRAELKLPGEFPADVLAEAEAAIARGPDWPAYADETAIEFVTIDPPGSRDLDQAFHAERRPGGYRVHYAIADPGAFVRDRGRLDVESRVRGLTLYCPDRRIPLYPATLAEGAGSLLAGEDRPAVLWTLDLDADAMPVDVDVRRAVVRSRAKLDYAGVQRDLDAGREPEPLVLLREIGELRIAAEQARGGVSLPVPTQEVVALDGGFALRFEAPLPVEEWNAQISLLTGMTAARLMLDARVGVLRTMPPPAASGLEALRRSAVALGVGWDEDLSYPDFVRSLDAREPAAAALLAFAATLQRGAGYTAFDGDPPEGAWHAAIAAPYAHATAPLRRCADRYVSEIALAHVAGRPVPDWVRAAVPTLPPVMHAAIERERQLERAVVGFVEAVTLSGHVGAVFEGYVVDTDSNGGVVQLREPAVRARFRGMLPLGTQARVRLALADPVNRVVEFTPAG